MIDPTVHSRMLVVGSTHAAKLAVDLVSECSRIAALVGVPGLSAQVRRECKESEARLSLRMLRDQLTELEHFIDGREPPVPVAPRAA